MSLLPAEAGNTLVYTGTLAPSGATFPSDTVFALTSSDPTVVPTVDVTGLIVTIPLPTGFSDSDTAPLTIGYSATSASTSMSLTGSITPTVPPTVPPVSVILPTGITFTQTV